ncbi:hypothetical protein L204_104643 [Cryptococcus depauperatus]|nr:hypothetical protein L204_03507 [Cryptococcus depauperatus CBS 7855]
MESQRPDKLPLRGLPILSGPPPIARLSACRQCNKDFNPIWRRKRICGHCGYEYCSSCLSDGQALMPRKAGQVPLNPTPLAEIKLGLGIEDDSESGGSGYDVESVCTHCLGMLQVTAAPLTVLRSLPIKRLKNYLAAYNISLVGAKEKEDIVQAIIKARNPNTGCLSSENESFYRRHSVPKGKPNQPSGTATSSRPSSFNSNPQTYASSYQRPQPRPPNNFRFPPPPQPIPQSAPQSQSQQRPSHTPQQARPSHFPAPTPATAPTHSPPVPTILSLVALPDSYLPSLNIGTLKAILYENHVRVDFKQVLEKKELIARVKELVDDERKRLERQRIAEQRLEEDTLSQPQLSNNANLADNLSNTIEHENRTGLEPDNNDVNNLAEKQAQDTSQEIEAFDNDKAKVNSTNKIPTGPMPEIERGLCVVCQDEEATLANVDCGHLCMCAHCSDLIMATSQECPLCRTRIVTKQRLIRIYRV